MSTKKKITFIIIALLVANLGVLSFMMLKPNHRNPNNGERFGENGPKQRMIKRLDLNEEQSKMFTDLVETHQKAVIVYDEKIRNDKQELFSLLSEEVTSPSTVDSLTNNIAAYQKEIEVLHFNHFKNVKSLCKGEQVEKFNKLSKDLCKMFDQKRGKQMMRKDKREIKEQQK